MYGNYIERSVGKDVFENFLRFSSQYLQKDMSCSKTSHVIEIEEGRVFDLYREFMKEHGSEIEGMDVTSFVEALKEIIDTLYSGPAVDYVMVNFDEENTYR